MPYCRKKSIALDEYFHLDELSYKRIKESLQFMEQDTLLASPYFNDHVKLIQDKGGLTIRNILVKEGDFIIKNAEGKFYPCKPDIFDKTYQRLTIEKEFLNGSKDED